MLTVALEEEDLAVPLSKQGNDQLPKESNGNSAGSGEHSEVTAIIPRLPAHLISEQPFFFLPTFLAKVLSMPTASDDPLRGAFLGLGYTCTRSHCKPGSFKTNAPWKVIWEVIREWARQKQPDRIPRLLGEGEFEGKASVNKSSPGAKILKRLRGRAGDTISIARMRESLLEKLGDGSKSMDIETASDLRDLLTSTLYDLDHLPAKLAEQNSQSNGVLADGSSTAPNDTTPKISGKALIDNGGDVSELDIVFDAERGRSFRESKGGKLVRYQINPRPNWGPMVRAGAGT
jgi:tRNA (guanine26-N2/guanine27-N2)-dimethyltransferase